MPKLSQEAKGGDGDEDEEELPDMDLNPFAISEGTTHEKLYSADPKKFLKEW